jgi:phage-related minor tail protein
VLPRNNRDINLVIRAKEEASAAFDNVVKVFERLADTTADVGSRAKKTGSDLEALAGLAVTLDRAYGQISGAADKAAGAFDRQRAALVRQREDLASLKAQADSAAAALRAIESAVVDRGLAGTGTADLVAQYKAAGVEAQRLEREIQKLTSTIATGEGALEGQVSALQQASSLANAAAEAQGRLAKQTRDVAAAEAEQAKAARVLPTIEAATGITRDRGDLDELVASLKAESDAHDNLISKLKAEQAATTSLAEAQDAQRRAATLLPGDATTGKSARDSASVFQQADAQAAAEYEKQLKETAAAEQAMDAAAAKLKAQLDPMADIQARLNRELAEADKLLETGRIDATEHAQALKLLQTNADHAAKSLGRSSVGGGQALFGLRPHEIQNLSYQINDVFTQLASGTSLTQTIGQQGGQLIQIFPKIGEAIGKALKSPPVLATAAAFGVLLAAVKNLNDEAERLRTFDTALSASADGIDYQAKALGDAAKDLDRYALSAKDAVSVIRIFTKEGVAPERVEEFGKAAADMAAVLGVDVKDAAKQLADAFTGDYDAIKKLDQATDFLTATQRDHIKALFDEGKTSEARAEALRVFVGRYDDAAQKMRGPWAQATTSLGNAWDSFITLVANTQPIVDMVKALDELGKSATGVFNRLNNATTLADISNEINLYYERIGKLNQGIADFGDPLGLKQAQIDEYSARIQKLIEEQKKLTAAEKPTDTNDTRAEQAERAAKATADLRAETDKLTAADKSKSAAERIAAAERDAGKDADATIAKDEFRFADEAAKAAFKGQQIAIARRKVEKEINDEIDARARKEEAAIKAVSGKIPGIESSGRTNATNPNSTATGLGQFTEGTWLNLFKKNFSDLVKDMTDARILALRTNGDLSKKAIEVYARENADALKKAGVEINEANLYLAHFLGAGGATKVLKAAPGTQVSSLLPQKAISANKSVLEGKTAGQVRDFAAQKVGDSSRAESQMAVKLRDIKLEQVAAQASFNDKINDELETRTQQIATMQAERGLQDAALIAEEKKQFVADAILKKQQEVDKINAKRVADELPEIEFAEHQKRLVTETAASYFDLANAARTANAQMESVMRPVQALTEKRDALRDQIDFMRSNGDFAGAAQLAPQLDAVNAKLKDATKAAMDWWTSIRGDPETLVALNTTADQVDAINIGLQKTGESAKEWGTVLNVSARDAAEAMSGSLVGAFDKFTESLAEGVSVFKSLKVAFRQFAADFLRQIAQMIEQQLVLNAVKGILSAVGVPVGTKHSGGIAGRSDNPSRMANPVWFAYAQRYHTGGIAGLKPGEVPAILKRGEEVITQDDPRHVMNGAGGGAAGQNIRIVNAIDSGDMLDKAISTRTGERALMNYIRANSNGVKNALGIA